MFIDGIGIKGYRSFGRDVQRLGPFSKVNLLVGQNNAGKSNVLRLIHEKYGNFFESLKKPSSPFAMLPGDFPLGSWDDEIIVEFGMVKGSQLYNHNIASLKSKAAAGPYGDTTKNLFDSFLEAIYLKGGNLVWCPYIANRHSLSLTMSDSVLKEATFFLDTNGRFLRELWTQITNRTGGGQSDWINGIIEQIRPYRYNSDAAPTVSLIPAVREVKIGNELKKDDFSGLSINHRLAQLQNPAFGSDRHTLLSQFANITHFLRTVTGNQDARIEIPYGYDNILVHMNNRVLPLGALGTGIHEVVILAAAATVLTNQVLCIEEPELHLHPVLQRKLIQYLQDKTTNQYFITTHSAHLLDAKNVAIFHVQLVDGYSVVNSASTSSHRSSICADLGYRASDLVQANCIIWVEGPSDRIYIRQWIKDVDPELVEGIHYSIMIYGGRLLSHLSASDDEITEFIGLRQLNRNLAIMIDSDRALSSDALNATKQRIVGEFDKGPGFAWVTAGREIENYFDGDDFEKIIESVHKTSFDGIEGKGEFARQSRFKNKAGTIVEIDKVKVAHRVIDSKSLKFQLDPSTEIDKLVAFINRSNNV